MNVPIKPLQDIALFCDFDGTLVNIAPTPLEVHLPAAGQSTITDLAAKCGQAFAVVSGRPLHEIKLFLTLDPFNGAGCHGAELEYQGQRQESAGEDPAFVAVKHRLQAFAEQHQLICEDKGHSFAIHFRTAPALEQSVDDFIDQVIADRPELKKLHGKAVREVKPSSFDKGSAIEKLLQKPLFTGRTPYYFGDDVTDEDAFDYINSIGGISVKIGTGQTRAQYRLDSPEHLFQFFDTLIQEHQ